MVEKKSITAGKTNKWLLTIFSAIIILAFFIPWVSWDKSKLSGADMPLGNFFSIAEQNYGLAAPFPQLNFLFPGVWLIPFFAGITLLLALFNKRSSFVFIVTCIMALSHVTIYYLFTNVLRDLGAQRIFQPGIYLTAIAAAVIIIITARTWVRKIVWLLIGPVMVYIGFYEVSKYLENEKFEDTANTSSVYTVTALDLIKEFETSDSLANAKYREKIVTVNGNITNVELPNDSTVNIKFVNNNTGSYAIFPFHDLELAEAKKLKPGDQVFIKASCSGGVLSEILGIESITFKRCTLIKQ